MTIRLSIWRVLPAMLALFVLAGPISLPAATVLPESTFLFSGNCIDCDGTATATLVLQNYLQGDIITHLNLVSFHYDGTNLLFPFTILSTDDYKLGGEVGTTSPSIIPIGLAAYANFHIEITDVLSFDSNIDGIWSATGVSRPGPDDFGGTGLWNGPVTNAVPEPGVFLLVAAGMAVIGVRRWKVRN